MPAGRFSADSASSSRSSPLMAASVYSNSSGGSEAVRYPPPALRCHPFWLAEISFE